VIPATDEIVTEWADNMAPLAGLLEENIGGEVLANI